MCSVRVRSVIAGYVIHIVPRCFWPFSPSSTAAPECQGSIRAPNTRNRRDTLWVFLKQPDGRPCSQALSYSSPNPSTRNASQSIQAECPWHRVEELLSVGRRPEQLQGELLGAAPVGTSSSASALPGAPHAAARSSLQRPSRHKSPVFLSRSDSPTPLFLCDFCCKNEEADTELQ